MPYYQLCQVGVDKNSLLNMPEKRPKRITMPGMIYDVSAAFVHIYPSMMTFFGSALTLVEIMIFSCLYDDNADHRPTVSWDGS